MQLKNLLYTKVIGQIQALAAIRESLEKKLYI